MRPTGSKPRKLTAILYADVSGYSSKPDDDHLHETLGRYLEIFAKSSAAHRGRIVHYAGDAVLAEFGSVADVLAAAVEVQTAIAQCNAKLPAGRQLWFRIGVNLGDVFEDGAEIYGNGVNVAARLEALADPGGVCVSDAARVAAGTYLPYAFEFMGETQVRNIEEPIRPYRLHFDDAEGKPDSAGSIITASLPPAPGVVEQGTTKPSIAVLPFKNLSGDSKQEHLVEGFAEDIITELSRFHSISVVARTSAFAFRDQTISVQAISERLGGIDFVLEGSIRHSAEQLRTTVRLVECRSGIQVWTQRYNAEVDEIFKTQDRLIADIVSHLELQIVEERLRATGHVPTETLKAYDLWLRGHQLMREWSLDADEKSVELFERSIQLDPDFARPYASLAGIYSSRAFLQPGNRNVTEDLALSKEYAKSAVKLDPLDGRVHIHLGWAKLLERNFESADRSFDQAGELNPNDADITISRALAVAYLGQPDKALRLAAEAAGRNPFHPDYYLEYAAMIRFIASRYAEAATMLEPFAEAAPPDVWAWYAAACSQVGRHADARRGGERFIAAMREKWVGHEAAGPTDFTRWFIRITPLARAEDVERLAAGLYGAGLPAASDLALWKRPASVA